MDIHHPDFEKTLLHHRVIFLQGEIDAKGTLSQHVISSLAYLNALDATTEITLNIDSTGGNHSLGNVIMENIKNSQSPVRGVVIGYAYSAGFKVLQACHTRAAYGHSRLMFHPTRINDLSIWYDRFDEYIQTTRNNFHYFLEELARRSGQTFDTLAVWAKQERCFNGFEAKTHGLIDTLI